MIDSKQSFRKGNIITEVHIDDIGVVTRSPYIYKSINKAKKANRQTQYRVIK